MLATARIAAAVEVTIPLNLDYLTLQEALKHQVFNGPRRMVSTPRSYGPGPTNANIFTRPIRASAITIVLSSSRWIPI